MQLFYQLVRLSFTRYLLFSFEPQTCSHCSVASFLLLSASDPNNKLCSCWLSLIWGTTSVSVCLPTTVSSVESVGGQQCLWLELYECDDITTRAMIQNESK